MINTVFSSTTPMAIDQAEQAREREAAEQQELIRNFQNDPYSTQITPEERAKLMEQGIRLNENGIRQLITTQQQRLSKYETLREDCPNDQCNDNNLQTRLENARNQLEETNNLISTQDTANILMSMDQQQREAYVGSQEEECSSWNIFCRLTSTSSVEQTYLNAQREKVSRLERGDFSQASNEMQNARNTYLTCVENGNENCEEPFANAYNEELVRISLSGMDESNIPSSCQGSQITRECRNEIDNLIATCNSEGGQDCQQLQMAKDSLNLMYDKTKVNPNIMYDILNYIQLDSAATTAASAFGIEPDYSYLPSFLKESFPSTICMGKIQGYLDKELQTNGGLTNYRYNPETGELEVTSDLRAQRTRVTPDGNTAITYSFFFRTFEESGGFNMFGGESIFSSSDEEEEESGEKLKYLIAVSYLQGGQKVKQQLTDIKETSVGGVAQGYDNVNLPINETLGEVNENSFTIGIIVTEPNGNLYLHHTAPVVLIGAGDYYNDMAGNPAGNEAGRNHQSGAATLTTQDMLQYMK